MFPDGRLNGNESLGQEFFFILRVRLERFIVLPLNKEDLESILLFVFCVSSLKYGEVNEDELDQTDLLPFLLLEP